MEQITVKLHSMTDLITNSSTTIYTISDGSVKPCEEMINEVLKLMGEDKKCNDIFDLAVIPDDDQLLDLVDEQLEDLLEPEEFKALKVPSGYSQRRDFYRKLISKIRSGEIDKPEWYDELMEEMEDGDHQCDTNLIITVKDKKFSKLADLVTKFLYSTQSEEGYN